jgi:cytoskeletal protein RodZ
MIGRGFWRAKATEEVEAKGFDAFELRLGDLMRGERATMGKSLLDVQRELKIKASYIAAIENADPTSFDTPGFIAGYVRSYARYLNMDPDWAFETFCRESGFATAHGMSAAASSVKPTREERLAASGLGKDIFAASTTPFIPAGDRMFSGIEPRAVGSILVLAALVGGLGYGGWSVLQEVQKVQFAPVEQAPTVVAEVDPLAGGSRPVTESGEQVAFEPPSTEALDRLYRPEALEVPIMVARDGPIAALDPDQTGTLAGLTGAATLPNGGAVDPASAAVDAALASVVGVPGAGSVPMVQVTAGPVPELQLVAVRPAWVRVKAPDGSVLFEGILDAGQTYAVPVTEQPATLRVGESGALYFALNGVAHGPVGPAGTVTSNVALSPVSIAETYAVADLTADSDLAELVNVAQADTAPQVLPEQDVPPVE